MNVEDVIALRRAVCEEGADHDEKCDDDMRAHGVNGCTLGEILASALLAAETETRERCARELEGYLALDAYEFPRPGYENRAKIEEGSTFPGLDELREEIISESYGVGIKRLIQFGRGVFHDAVIRSAKHFAAAIRNLPPSSTPTTNTEAQ